MNPSLEQEFNEEVLSLFAKTGQATGYWPRYFLRKARKVGGHKLAQDLLQLTTKTATGFGRLAEANRLDLSIEYLSLQPRWSPLFTDQEQRIARQRLETAGYFTLPEEIPDIPCLVEGAAYQIQINAYERNPKARAECIAHYGATCVACGFSFGAVYGAFVEKIIHVHHLKPLSDIGKKYKINPIKDLRPVCPNCHVVIHWGGEIRTIPEVQELIRLARMSKHRNGPG